MKGLNADPPPKTIKTPNNNKMIIKADELKAGIYIFTLKGNKVISRKLVITD